MEVNYTNKMIVTLVLKGGFTHTKHKVESTRDSDPFDYFINTLIWNTLPN